MNWRFLCAFVAGIPSLLVIKKFGYVADFLYILACGAAYDLIFKERLK